MILLPLEFGLQGQETLFDVRNFYQNATTSKSALVWSLQATCTEKVFVKWRES